MKKTVSLFVSILLLTAAVVGCGRRPQYQPDLNQILTDLEALAAQHRPVGSQGERDGAAYVQGRFSELGYTVTIQPYEDGQGRAGTNVIAVREATSPDADILVIASHHDSAPTSYGANDSASGVAALLSAAQLLQDVKTDTELRFISFTDEENGKNGSRVYTASLSPEELDRMVGCIQLDMLGGLGSRGMVVCTMDGRGNWLSDLLQKKNTGLELAAETAGDHASFQLAGVPSVLLMQKGRGYLYHSAADRVDQLNLDAIALAAKAAAEAATEIAGRGTASYRDQAAEPYFYRQTRQTVIGFDGSLADTQSQIGAPGQLVDTQVRKRNGWIDTYTTYLYLMRWFGGEVPMNTCYQYRNGFLQSIEIHPGETGYTLEQVRALIAAMYGEPTSSGTDREENPYEAWQDEVYSKYLTLTDRGADFTVSVSKYSLGVSNTLAGYKVREGEAEIADPEDAAVWELLCSILPAEYRQKIARFELFTDGAGGILAYTAPVMEDGAADNSRFCMTVDYYDIYDENHQPRDWSKLTYTLLHEYGHVLLEDETQIDLRVGQSTHDPAGFIEGSLRKAFYDRFWAGLGTSGVRDYEKNPTSYVSRCGANYFHEDMADTFAMFLLGGKPVGDTVAEEKLLFFWEYPEMVALRSAVRQKLGLSDG